MSGPVTMAFGSFMFSAHGFGFRDVSRKLDTSWAEIETIGRLNALQWMGPRSDTLIINGVLFPEEWGGEATLEGVRLAAINGLPLMLVAMNGQVFGNHAIQKFEEDRTVHDRYGSPGRNAYSIEAKRVETSLSPLSVLGVF